MKPHAADCATCAIALAHDEEKEKRRASLDLIDREELGRFVVARCRSPPSATASTAELDTPR